VAERLLETGYEVIDCSLPCVITVVKEINEPRLPSLKGKMKARKAEITVWGSGDLEVDEEELGLDGSPTRVVRVFAPEARSGGTVFEGEVEDTVESLVRELVPILKGES